MLNVKSVKGFKDIFPPETYKWQFVEKTARDVFSRFGVGEIKIPVIERTELFKRGIGETTDIVEKEMYTFLDRGNEYLTLRPEATASVIRAYLEHNLYKHQSMTRLFTIGPMFRRERPQKGRFRQFQQIDVEFIGQKDPRVDSELISMLMHFLSCVGLKDITLEINSLGCSKCRPSFRSEIVSFLMDKEGSLCGDCQRRLQKNPLRIFDCKNDSCKSQLKGAPVILEFLCEDCSDHFNAVKNNLDLLKVPYLLNTTMVRGLDYYTNTAFEVTTKSLGAQNAVAGGGRYDGLTSVLGGPQIPGIGFAIGFDRLVSMIPCSDEEFYDRPDIFIAALGSKAESLAFIILNALRTRGFKAEMEFSGKSLKSQMKSSDKLRSRHTLIIGDNEIEKGQAPLRDMETKKQVLVSIDPTNISISDIERALIERQESLG